jgi:raffinose/stachyose/melibiose transport system permease protein
MASGKPVRRWHIAVFLAPAVLVYSRADDHPAVRHAAAVADERIRGRERIFVGLRNFATLFGDALWSDAFWNALGNNTWFFVIHMLVQNPIGIALAAILSTPRLRMAAFYRTAIFIPTILSFVIVGFMLEADPVADLGHRARHAGRGRPEGLFAPWLGKEEYALTTLALISVWQFVGIPMMLIYAALLSRSPTRCSRPPRWTASPAGAQFWKIKLPLILPAIGIISILTFVGNFNAFDLIYVAQGALAGPDYSTDILGTFLYRTFFGFQLQLGDPLHGLDHRRGHVRHHPGGCLHLPVRHPDPPAEVSVLMASARMSKGRTIAAHAVLLTYTLIALFPVFVIVVNSFKSRKAIFADPLSLPLQGNFDLVGYQTVMKQGDFFLYFPEQPGRHGGQPVLRAAVRRHGRLCPVGIPLSRQYADGAVPGPGHHDPDPPGHRRDP